MTKTSWFVTVSQTIRLSTVNVKVKPVLQTSQHMTKQVKKIHTSKVKHTQTEQSERRENRYQKHNNESRNEYAHNQSPLIMLK